MEIETVFSSTFSLNDIDSKIKSPDEARKELFEKLGEKYDYGVVRKNSTWKRVALNKDLYYTAVLIFLESNAFNLLNTATDFTLFNVFSAAGSDFISLLFNGTHPSKAIEFLEAVAEKLNEIGRYDMATEFKKQIKTVEKFFSIIPSLD